MMINLWAPVLMTNSPLRFIVLGLIFGSLANAAHLKLPPATERKVAEALAAAAGESRRGENPAAFRNALLDLRKTLSSEVVQSAIEQEGESVDAKIIAIANALALDPARFEEIYSYYVANGESNSLREQWSRDNSSVSVSPIVVPVPRLRPEHASVEYLPVWEFYMLIPRVDRAPHRFSDLVREALIKIGDLRSISVVEYRYKAGAADERFDPGPFNALLLAMPSPSAMRALLACVEAWNNQVEVRRSQTVIPGLSEPEDAAMTTLITELKGLKARVPEKAEQWRTLAKGSHGVNPAQAAILEAVRAALDAN